MEPLYVFGLAILTFIILSIVFKFVKLAIKIIGTIFLILIIGTAFLGYSAYKEVKEFQESDSPIVFLLEDAGNILAGFSLEGKNFTPISQERITQISNEYLEGNLAGLKDTYLKTIIISSEFIEENLESIDLDFGNLNKEEILNILNTNNLEEIALILSEGSEEQAEIILQSLENENIEEIKTAIFASATFKTIESEALNNLMEAYKNEEIQILPEGIFKIIKLFPSGLIGKIIENVR
jgi:hypothetical protein